MAMQIVFPHLHVPVRSQGNELSCICVLGVLVLHLSTSCQQFCSFCFSFYYQFLMCKCLVFAAIVICGVIIRVFTSTFW